MRKKIVLSNIYQTKFNKHSTKQKIHYIKKLSSDL